MLRHANLLLVNCIVACFVVLCPPQPVQAQQGRAHTQVFNLDGLKRSFILYRPSGLTAASGLRPLVIVIHGGAGTAQGMMRLTRSRWNTLADQHGFFVVYPEGVDRMWDFGEGAASALLDQRVNDLAYFRTLIAQTAQTVPIDRSRIFATGLSRGAQASFYLACNLPGQIKAIMPVATNLPKYMVNECRSGPPVGVALITGTDDPQVPFNGGTITVLGQRRDVVLSSEQTMALWQNRNGCGNKLRSSTYDQRPNDGVSVTLRDWSCSGAPLRHYTVQGGGHTWPSGRQFLPRRLVGRVSRDINAADEGWAFFSQF
ncbi:MAG: PHB depolymerase family esterase [Paracoccaceae bacterium]